MFSFISGIIIFVISLYLAYLFLTDKIFRQLIKSYYLAQIIFLIVIIIMLSGIMISWYTIMNRDGIRVWLIKIGIILMRIGIAFIWLFIEVLRDERNILMKSIFPFTIASGASITYSTFDIKFVRILGFWERESYSGELLTLDIILMEILFIGLTISVILTYRHIGQKSKNLYKWKILKKYSRGYMIILIYNIIMTFLVNKLSLILYNIMIVINVAMVCYLWVVMFRVSPFALFPCDLELRGYAILSRDFLPLYVNVRSDSNENIDYILSIVSSVISESKKISLLALERIAFVLAYGKHLILILILTNYLSIAGNFAKLILNEIEKKYNPKTRIIKPKHIDNIMKRYLQIFI